MTIILGINAYHGDSSACLVRDGKLVAAAEEERFNRIKHWAGFPAQAIDYCLAEAGVSLSEVEHVAVNSDPRAQFSRKIGYLLTHRPNFALLSERIKERKERATIEDEFAKQFPGQAFRGQVHKVEHHLAHLASAFLVGPFEKAAIVSVDGFGDFASAAWGMGEGTDIRQDGRVFFPHSLGIFYMAMTQYLGFPNWGDEYKVMGLAPYGKPTYLDQMRQVVRLKSDGGFELDLRFFRHHRERTQQWHGSSPHVDNIYTDEVTRLLGPARSKNDPLTEHHHDIARSIQAMYEEAFFHLLNAIHPKYGTDDLTIAGGCGNNSVANGRVYANTPFKRVYVQSAAGDAGGAIGAAFVIAKQLGLTKRDHMAHAYWGPAFDDETIGKLLSESEAALGAEGCETRRVHDKAALVSEVSEGISEGLVIGWYQGRMEWGPRALGNRSILGDPRRADMKDILNLKIKRRESFRPFAPSVLREHVPDWFEKDDNVPFMMQVYPIKVDKREKIPAVTHVDGSGRLQTVDRETNPLYWELINQFRERTGVPMVLNTSFNENEPVVCTPKEALGCFLRTKMDILVMGEWIVRRKPSA